MLDIEGMSKAGIERKATCRALFSKLLYLAGAFLSVDKCVLYCTSQHKFRGCEKLLAVLTPAKCCTIITNPHLEAIALVDS